jgi:deoxyribodipyrimidine photo-lyase
MTIHFENGLFVFRRDLRIIDNKGLNLLSNYCKNIYTIFIFTPEQVENNIFKSDNAIQFMIESLMDLASQISKNGGNLFTFYGHNDKIISECIKAFDIKIVGFNLDITPYAKERDEKIIKLCEHLKTYVIYDYDYYLHEPGTIVSGSKEPYQKFTPYYEASLKKKVELPAKMRKLHFSKKNGHFKNQISISISKLIFYH